MYEIPSGSNLKSDTFRNHSHIKNKINTTTSEINAVRVYKDVEAVVIKGVDLGLNIQVYTTTGTPIKSIINDNEVINIKLPKKQIYIINIGQTRYKSVL